MIRPHPLQWYETSIRPYRLLGRGALLLRFGLIGLFAGFAATALFWGLSFAFEVERPTILVLAFAMLRGALFAMIIGWALWWRWHRS